VVGGGFAGFHAARALSRLVNRRRRTRPARVGQIEIVLINPMDYFLYLPLLPEVAGGILDPRRVAASGRAFRGQDKVVIVDVRYEQMYQIFSALNPAKPAKIRPLTA